MSDQESCSQMLAAARRHRDIIRAAIHAHLTCPITEPVPDVLRNLTERQRGAVMGQYIGEWSAKGREIRKLKPNFKGRFKGFPE